MVQDDMLFHYVSIIMRTVAYMYMEQDVF